MAKIVTLLISGLNVSVSGTLDGYLDFHFGTKAEPGLTYQITPDDARLVIAALLCGITDVETNCLYDADPLLMKEGESRE